MPKNIVICSDGTGQSADSINPSNVVRLCSLLDLANPKNQICCYDAGVGTMTKRGGADLVRRLAPQVKTLEDKERSLVKRVLRPGIVLAGKAVGYGLKENIEQMYQYLSKNYIDGDHIYLFGFSRGAFTMRVLAGLLYRCGLLRENRLGRFSEAYEEHYADRHYESIQDPNERERIEKEDDEFRSANARSCKVEFLGIWDTVKSYGYFWPQGLPNTRHNPIVNTVRHALSIDEQRSTFVQTSWGWGDLDVETGCPLPTEAQRNKDVHEVWFTGDHSDVGGGYEDAESGLAKISLKWMIGETWNVNKDPAFKLLMDEGKYRDMFKDFRPGPNAPLFKRHNRLTDWKLSPIDTIGWWVSNGFPRVELRNCPLPPSRHPWLTPTGQRKISDSRRNGKILIHESVEQVYGQSKEQLCSYWKKEGRLRDDIDSKDILTAKTTEFVHV
jgi:uncharacterized protein (DUF2235 family)